MVNALVGVGGLIEYTLRTALQRHARANALPKDSYEHLADVVEALNPYIRNPDEPKLFEIARQIRNKLIHADFPGLYRKTGDAYAIPGISYSQSAFEPIVKTYVLRVGSHGATLNNRTGEATDTTGTPIPVLELVPGSGGSIEIDFVYFYETGHFIHVYDVLATAYQAALNLRHEP
ncbi:MAG: hypothetical protein F9K30_16145 [Dechloromonas sp.]|nr:MAG: hypothetical protein F9K30_16145 [Dechloromonas sp.]